MGLKLHGGVNIPCGTQLASYDFWAIGINCCSPSDPSFTGCAGLMNKQAVPAGLRLMYPQQGAYFRLAISQAEAEFGLEASDAPLLFYWSADPDKSLAKFAHSAFETKIRHTFLHGSVNLVLSFLLVAVYI